MITIEQNADYRKQIDKHNYANALPCIVCGREVKKPKYWIRLWYGCSAVLPSEIPSLEPGGDTGFYPIGSDCVKKHPELKEYLNKEPSDEV